MEACRRAERTVQDVGDEKAAERLELVEKGGEGRMPYMSLYPETLSKNQSRPLSPHRLESSRIPNTNTARRETQLFLISLLLPNRCQHGE